MKISLTIQDKKDFITDLFDSNKNGKIEIY